MSSQGAIERKLIREIAARKQAELLLEQKSLELYEANQQLHLVLGELQRQTHLEAMALTLGITMIFTVVYGSLPTAQLLADTHPTNILFVMGITYMLAVMRIWISRTSE